MAQPTPSGSEVSKVESDVSQTLSLADSIVTLLREPVAMLYQNITKAQELRRSLGQWHAEAIDDDKQYRIPMLGVEEFEKYLSDTDGCLLPSPEARQGKACWAYLLHALGIQPGRNIVNWRPSTDGFISTQNGGIEMEIDGAVLCHIINLYSIHREPRSGAARDNGKAQQRYHLQFGELAWETIEGQIHGHFRPGSENQLNSSKIPFKLKAWSFSLDYLKFE